ncbi:Dps family protein [Anaeroselena agilis]|uniref:DNA starvation/stationary phase protection protein n=1 Tax=Anaeroselena agilis TaxID=3063788 RepID=A0ABU3NVA2_9FIRM|nr:DNA starvation/stationary phase protection protein [Selenomonadales bacterium 4137-cl]
MKENCCPDGYCPNGLKPEQTRRIVEGLNIYLANLNILYIKLHNLHWNVTGTGFFPLHAKTQELYEAVAEKLDEAAERIRALGCVPLASMREYLAAGTICELPGDEYPSPFVAKTIIEDFCTMLEMVRKIEAVASETSDQCTVGLLAEAMCFFEKQMWMMGAYLTRC